MKLQMLAGSSNVLKVSLVTYSNKYKMEFGVTKNTLEKYTVYSCETAKEMAKNISDFAASDIGIGITGELRKFNKRRKFCVLLHI